MLPTYTMYVFLFVVGDVCDKRLKGKNHKDQRQHCSLQVLKRGGPGSMGARSEV